MKIEFDPDKAAANPTRHGGVTFEEAKSVLLDPFALTHEDRDHEEPRFVTLGMGGKARLLVVAWTCVEKRSTSFQHGKLKKHKGDAMKTSSAPLREEYRNLDFARARPVSEIPALARLQAEQGGKTRITMRIDNAVLSAFRERAEKSGASYQSMMNEALCLFVQGWSLSDVVRQAVRDEMHA